MQVARSRSVVRRCVQETFDPSRFPVSEGQRLRSVYSTHVRTKRHTVHLLDRPFCERDLMFCVRYLLFMSQLTFSDVRQPTFSKLLHMMWLQPQRKRCYADFLKVPPDKNEWRKKQISPDFASNGNTLSAITRNVKGK